MELLALADSAEDWIYIPRDYLSKLIKLASPHPPQYRRRFYLRRAATTRQEIYAI
jgi:hypothetical protein